MFTAASPIKIYKSLLKNAVIDSDGTNEKNLDIRLKLNNPISPQLKAPIITNIKDSLSNKLTLYIIFPLKDIFICLYFYINICFKYSFRTDSRLSYI
jgi:hypothetical protein